MSQDDDKFNKALALLASNLAVEHIYNEMLSNVVEGDGGITIYQVMDDAGYEWDGQEWVESGYDENDPYFDPLDDAETDYDPSMDAPPAEHDGTIPW